MDTATMACGHVILVNGQWSVSPFPNYSYNSPLLFGGESYAGRSHHDHGATPAIILISSFYSTSCLVLWLNLFLIEF